ARSDPRCTPTARKAPVAHGAARATAASASCPCPPNDHAPPAMQRTARATVDRVSRSGVRAVFARRVRLARVRDVLGAGPLEDVARATAFLARRAMRGDE